MSLIASILSIIKSNPLVAGGAGMALVGWGMVQLRALPKRIWSVVQDQFSATLTVYSEDSFFNLLNLWLARHPSARRSRRLNIQNFYDRENDHDDYALTPGAGYHLLREGTRFYLVHRVYEETKSEGFNQTRRKQTLHVTTFGRSREPLLSLVTQAKTVQEDADTIPVYVWQGDFCLVERRPKRSIETIYLDRQIKEAIVSDIRTFQASRAIYARRCIPYRRGYLLEGPTGTGKSSLIFALASEFDLPIYIINIAGLGNDNDLLRAVNRAGRGLLVIEDIDAAGKAATSREIIMPVGGASPMLSAMDGGITLSGLLNATDGIATKDGRILFMTSNCPETLDEALIRPGRCDRRFHLGLGDDDVANQMIAQFFPNEDPQPYAHALGRDLPLAPSSMQQRLLELEASNAAISVNPRVDSAQASA